MDAMASAVLALALRFAPPGRSPHSVIPVPECGADPTQSACAGVPFCAEAALECLAPRWSRHHDAWVRVEPASVAVRRYRGIAEQLVRTGRTLLGCADAACEPLEWGGTEREL